MNDVVAVISQCLLRSRRQQIIISLFIAVPGIFMLAGPHAGQPETTQLTIRIFGTLFLSGAAIIFFSAYKHFTPGKSNILRKLKHSPEHVVWVYSYIIELMPYGIHLFKSATVFFMLDDGNYHTVRVNEKELGPLMNTLKQSLPHATFGYSSEKEQLFLANPELLRKE